MNSSKQEIIQQLQKDILLLQGFKPPGSSSTLNRALGPLREAFPNKVFPTAAIHEFICNNSEEMAASSGFSASLLKLLMQETAALVWISAARTIFPNALSAFGIAADRIIFIDLAKEKDILPCMEEALKCDGLAAVVAEAKEIGFTASRRLQLAVEQSKVTGFILRNNPGNLHSTASVCRWKVSSLPTANEEDLPGLGFPKWKVELLKVRNGKPGEWEVQFIDGRFVYPAKPILHLSEVKRKTG